MDFREITERSKLKDDKLSVWREGQISQIHCRFSRKWCTYSVSTNFRPELIDQPSAKDNIFKSCRERRARGEWGEMWTWRSNLSCFQTVILSYINHCRVDFFSSVSSVCASLWLKKSTKLLIFYKYYCTKTVK